MSLGARLLNVYATPGDVFEWVRQKTECCTSNWLIPALLSCLVGVVFTWIALSQPNVEQQIREQQDQKIQQLVDSGKLSAADAETARKRIEQINLMMVVKMTGMVSVVVMSFAMTFIVAVVLKLTALWWLRASVEYMKWVEVAGLSAMVLVLGTVVQLLLVIIMGSILATPGPVLLVGEIDPQNKLHLALSSINLVTFWYLCILGLGLAKLAGGGFIKAVVPLLGLWAVLRGGIVLLGWGSSGM
jgi:hypothetical protein